MHWRNMVRVAVTPPTWRERLAAWWLREWPIIKASAGLALGVALIVWSNQ